MDLLKEEGEYYQSPEISSGLLENHNFREQFQSKRCPKDGSVRFHNYVHSLSATESAQVTLFPLGGRPYRTPSPAPQDTLHAGPI